MHVVDVIQIDLQRGAPVRRRLAHQRPVQTLPAPDVVDHDEVLVRIGRRDVLPEGFSLCGCVVVLLADVPVEAQMMGEARDQLAVIELALGAELTGVHVPGVLDLHELELHEDALPLHVLEDHLPLRELGDREARPIFRVDVWRHVAVVAVHAVGEERLRVQPFRGEIVHCADEAFALAVLPGRIAVLPVGDVWGVLLAEPAAQAPFPFVVGCVVEVFVGEQVLGRVRADLQKVLVRARELEVVPVDVPSIPFARKSLPVLSVSATVNDPVRPSKGASAVPAVGESATATPGPCRKEMR